MERVSVTLTFHPPNKRRRDQDGMLAALKASLDGVSDGLMVDDHLFDLTPNFREPVKGGKVVVEITTARGN